MQKKKITIFGIGNLFEIYRNRFVDMDIVGLFDNDNSKWGNTINGVKIYSPDLIPKMEFDEIYLLSHFGIEAIYKQVKSLGIQEEKIKFYYDIPCLESDYTIYENRNMSCDNKSKTVTIISNSFYMSGTLTCVLVLTKILIDDGFKVLVASPYSGDVIEELLCMGASVVVDERLLTGKLSEFEWLDSSDLVLINTVDYYYLFRDINIPGKIIWWLHEPPFHYNYFLLKKWLKENVVDEKVDIWAVSDVAKKGFETYNNAPITVQPYGLVDYAGESETVSRGFKFVSVGNVTEVKGFDLLIKAFLMFTQSEKKDISLTIVGDVNNEYGKKLYADYLKEENVFFTGSLSHEEALRFIKNADVYVCSSYQESMSISVNEALMYKKAVICSSETGNYSYFINEKNGIIFSAGDEEDLHNKMRWALNNREKLMDIGKEGRIIFEKCFSIESFKMSVLRRINDCIVRA